MCNAASSGGKVKRAFYQIRGDITDGKRQAVL